MLFVTAAAVTQVWYRENCFPADCFFGDVWDKLTRIILAPVFLVPMNSFSAAFKICFIAAFWKIFDSEGKLFQLGCQALNPLSFLKTTQFDL